MRTINDETYRATIVTIVTQYLCMTVVLYFVYFHPSDEAEYPLKALMNGLGFFNGKYSDFTEGWYDEVGQKILIPVAMQIVVPHMRNGVPYLIMAFKRWKDTGYNSKSSETKCVT